MGCKGMAEFKKTISNLSEADFLIVSELCSEHGVSLENKSIRMKADEKATSLLSKFNKYDKTVSELIIRLDIISDNIDLINYIYFLINRRRNIIHNLEACLNSSL